MAFIFPYIGKNIIPTDEVIFFRGGETSNQIGVDHWGTGFEATRARCQVYEALMGDL
jgi:hypothetical protein